MLFYSTITTAKPSGNIYSRRTKIYLSFGVGQMKEISEISANHEYNLPSVDRTPQPIHTTRHIPTDPVRSSTPFGDTKIPDPVEERVGSRRDRCRNSIYIDDRTRARSALCKEAYMHTLRGLITKHSRLISFNEAIQASCKFFVGILIVSPCS